MSEDGGLKSLSGVFWGWGEVAAEVTGSGEDADGENGLLRPEKQTNLLGLFFHLKKDVAFTGRQKDIRFYRVQKQFPACLNYVYSTR